MTEMLTEEQLIKFLDPATNYVETIFQEVDGKYIMECVNGHDGPDEEDLWMLNMLNEIIEEEKLEMPV